MTKVTDMFKSPLNEWYKERGDQKNTFLLIFCVHSSLTLSSFFVDMQNDICTIVLKYNDVSYIVVLLYLLLLGHVELMPIYTYHLHMRKNTF